jgi:hypothetical protein
MGDDGMMECEWRSCTNRGDPWVDLGWVWWIRKYLWLEEGFYCPEHNALLLRGIEMGAFDNWPLDASQQTTAVQEAMSQFTTFGEKS